MPFRRDGLRCLVSEGPAGGHRAGSAGFSFSRHLLEAFEPVPAVIAYPSILRQSASSRAVVLGWYIAFAGGLRAGSGHARYHSVLSVASAPVPAFPSRVTCWRP